MASHDINQPADRQRQDTSPDIEKKGDNCELGGCCGMVAGPGGRLRMGLLIALAVVVIGLLVYGFATAG